MIILMSGRIATGKTAVCAALSEHSGIVIVSARQALLEMTGAPPTRADLQRAGAELDRRTAGRWLLEYLRDHWATGSAIVDAVRTQRQTEPVLEEEPRARLVYLSAHDETRRNRYARAAQTDPVKRSTPFDAAENHPTERNVVNLAPLAHLRLETDEATAGEVADEILAQLGAT